MMKTRFIKITDLPSQADEIKAAADLIKDGEVVAIPTETVYGLATNAFNPQAVRKIFEAKGRPQDNPLIVHIADINGLYEVASEVPSSALRLAEKFWPGPLTIILPKKDCIPDEVSAGLDTVAIRMPSHKVAHEIIKESGVPLAAPSANISGFPSPTCAQYVYDDMNGRVAAIIDGGECEVGIESTVITLCTPVPRLLRPGGITLEQLESVLGEVETDEAVLSPLAKGAVAASPGMKYRHYSPKAKITIIKGDITSFLEYVNAHLNEADHILCFEDELPLMPLPAVSMGRENDSLSQAKRLFDALRELDEHSAVNVFSRLPSKNGVGLGVCNRLFRAAGFSFAGSDSEITHGGIVVGLSGGSGSGKSTVSERLEQLGAVITDADKTAHQVLSRGSETLKKLSEIFGSDIILADGSPDRKKIAERAFSSEENTLRLNSVTHPAILSRCEAEIAAARAKGLICVVDAPLLFTSSLNLLCDITVNVYAPERVRLNRITERDGVSEEQAKRRFSAQQNESTLAENADFTFNNFSPYSFDGEITRLMNAIDAARISGGEK